jgi:dipeptidyl aminopeptidase/acylaminoacyl peptidase
LSEIRPYGSWRSPITAGAIAAGSLRMSQPQLDGGCAYWLEGRPVEAGRQQVVAHDGHAARDVTPASVNVRNRVHEYGGGDYRVRGGRVFYSRFDDGGVDAMDVDGAAPVALAGGGARHADFEVSPDGRWLVCVEERDREGTEASNRLLAIPLTGGSTRPFAEGFDFVSFPRFSRDARRLLFTAWRHPDMPWDATELHAVDFGEAGPAAVERLAGGGDESIFQPGFSPAGHVTFVSDRSGWWNLEQLRDASRRTLRPHAAEYGRPQWVFGMATWAYVDEGTILCAYAADGRQHLARLHLEEGRLDDLQLPFEAFDGLAVEGDVALFIGAAADRPPAVVRLDLRTDRFDVLRESSRLELGAAQVSLPEALELPTRDGERTRAFFYAPTHPEHTGPSAERPPLLVRSHGGPTGAASSALDPRIQFWASRGFAVADVNYRGSTGFGRAYRDRLRGEWGVVDVGDCVDTALQLAADGRVDGQRLAISGGSAGGYTTLCALTFHDVFHAGASHYGIGDLEALVRDTHKFESRYTDRLVGPYPERRDLYVARSPIHHADQLSCPVAFFQGLEDRVVPPNQAEAMVAALARRGIPHAYVAFAGEQHGFRRAENVVAALEGELVFYGRVFGFDVDTDRTLEIVGL